ncbi:MAG: 23S rRNA (pseudouridine(1915)-N(3))-methyltransferase RlmH [Limnohabitans sp.]|nr:23S rRNA (pseudouridine(1915)-N(3))-methyltransferase RlmH [Limnohabitans sp.]
MKLWVVAVGQRVPPWAQTAWDDYAKRFPPDLKLTLKTVKTEPRASKTLAQIWAAERSRIDAALPKDCLRVWLDEKGQQISTGALAGKWRGWQDIAQDVAFIIGGPDGFDPVLREGGHELLALSNLTLPHAMVRVLLVEQLYRAWSMLSNHPYHRE